MLTNLTREGRWFAARLPTRCTMAPSPLYFMGFCREQAPLRERMEAIYGMSGQPRDALTDYSTPAFGSYYFAPSVESLNTALE